MSGAQGSYLTVIATPSLTKKTLNSWACMEWLYFKVFHRGYNMTVPTPIRHQDKSRDLHNTPVLQPEPSHAFTIS